MEVVAMSAYSRLKFALSDFIIGKKKVNQKKAKYRRFNLIFLTTALVPLISVGIFNVAVDPYGIYNSPTFTQFNQSKPEKWKHQRLFKAIAITRIKPVTIFLGSSRMNLGLNPAYSALDDMQPAYNLGLNGANTYETLRYLQHAIKNQKDLKLVILGLDFIMFNQELGNQPGFDEGRLEKQAITSQDFINTTFSLDTLSLSEKTIEANKTNLDRDIYYPNGFMRLQRGDKDKNLTEFKKSIAVYFNVHSDYKLSQQYLDDLREIVNLCRERGITLIGFISPAHVTQSEAIYVAGQWQILEQWKQEVVKILPIWDFSDYNSITTESVSEKMKNYIDSSHYKEAIGNLVLDRILSYKKGEVPKDFGVYLTPENIEPHLAKIRANREKWVKANPNDAELVKIIKQERETKKTK
jgi:glutathione peroxidase-family protein